MTSEFPTNMNYRIRNRVTGEILSYSRDSSAFCIYYDSYIVEELVEVPGEVYYSISRTAEPLALPFEVKKWLVDHNIRSMKGNVSLWQYRGEATKGWRKFK